jgi:diadenosine tetraphosphate (Ap4A) HIT family hydrolase
MTNSLEEFEEKFRVQELAIFRSAHWSWSVRPVHSTVGSGILSLNRFARSFAEITPEEGADLANTLRTIESALQQFSAPDKMNYVMLMMVDVHLHFHVLPRYSTPRTVAGTDWIDSGWPALPAMGDYGDRQDSPVLLQIRDSLRNLVA